MAGWLRSALLMQGLVVKLRAQQLLQTAALPLQSLLQQLQPQFQLQQQEEPHLALEGVPAHSCCDDEHEHEHEHAPLDFDGYVHMGPVPKKKRSLAHTRQRMNSRFEAPQEHILTCQVCGHARFRHHLCTFCLRFAREERRANNRAAAANNADAGADAGAGASTKQ
eukprot:m.56058 g.56058  ORF g.56058 m.56058 type:complete len:166 (+) comp13366_c0_seq1:86-583(+)